MGFRINWSCSFYFANAEVNLSPKKKVGPKNCGTISTVYWLKLGIFNLYFFNEIPGTNKLVLLNTSISLSNSSYSNRKRIAITKCYVSEIESDTQAFMSLLSDELDEDLRSFDWRRFKDFYSGRTKTEYNAKVFLFKSI